MSIIHIRTPSGHESQHDEAEIRDLWEQGLIEEGTLFLREDATHWQPLSEYFEQAADGSMPMHDGDSASLAPALAPAAPEQGYAYTKEIKPIATVLIVFLWINFGFDCIAILSDLGQLSLLSRVYTDDEATANDLRQGLVGCSYLIVFFTTATIFGVWIYRACANCHGFSHKQMRFTPGWSVGWYFVPIMNLLRPYQAMKEIWHVSEDPVNWDTDESAPLVSWWWGLWLLAGFTGQAVFRTSLQAETVEALRGVTLLSILASVMGIGVTLLAIRLVKDITANQEKLVRQV